MSQGAVVLGVTDLAVASGLVAVAGGVSLAMGLGLGRTLGVAAVRTVVQLALVGMVLKAVMATPRVGTLALVLAVMFGAASRAAAKRPSRRFDGVEGVCFLALLVSGLFTVLVVAGLVVHPDPWWHPRFFIPLLGMVLGNGLTGVSLCLDKLLEALDLRRAEVEAALALGATRREAALPVVRDAVRNGMVPILNSMAVVGVVALPGMMTGQILAGADPMQAVAYQVVVMFMLAGATSLGTMGVALLATRVLFDEAHRLRAERIRE